MSDRSKERHQTCTEDRSKKARHDNDDNDGETFGSVTGNFRWWFC